jgi:integrase/recombinase XerC
MELGVRSGWFRVLGKGNKQRMVPVPLPARKALAAYLDCRPPFDTDRVFVGERGALTDSGIRGICRRYSAITGIHVHPHAMRHTFAKTFLAESRNDLVALAAILGHESLETTRRYVQRSESELLTASEGVSF